MQRITLLGMALATHILGSCAPAAKLETQPSQQASVLKGEYQYPASIVLPRVARFDKDCKETRCDDPSLPRLHVGTIHLTDSECGAELCRLFPMCSLICLELNILGDRAGMQPPSRIRTADARTGRAGLDAPLLFDGPSLQLLVVARLGEQGRARVVTSIAVYRFAADRCELMGSTRGMVPIASTSDVFPVGLSSEMRCDTGLLGGKFVLWCWSSNGEDSEVVATSLFEHGSPPLMTMGAGFDPSLARMPLDSWPSPVNVLFVSD
jgi:hypothetical protein